MGNHIVITTEDLASERRMAADKRYTEGMARAAARYADDVNAAVAVELEQLLRGRPVRESVLALAESSMAELRDTLTAADSRKGRQMAWRQALDHGDDGIRRAAEQVLDARDPEGDARRDAQQRRREERLLRQAEEASARGRALFGDDARLAVASGTMVPLDDDRPIVPRKDVQVFITALKTRETATATEEWVAVFRMATARKSDATQLGKDAWRLAKQITEELEAGSEFYRLELAGEEEWRRLRDAWRQRRARGADDVRWQVYRQDGDAIVVIHDDARRGGVALPAEFDQLKAITRDLLADMPGDGERRVRTSPGFGGNYQGSRGDGRARAASGEGVTWRTRGQFVTEGGLLRAAETLGTEIDARGRGQAQMAHEDALILLMESGFTLKPRKAHTGALSAFDFILASQQECETAAEDEMSHLASITGSPIYTLSVTFPVDDVISDSWPMPETAEERQIQPIYLPGMAEEVAKW